MFIHNMRYLAPLIMCFIILFSCSCAGIKPDSPLHNHVIIKNDDFLIVKTPMTTDFSTLAARYLNDPSKASLIATFNDTKEARPGQEVVIPLRPCRLGGLEAEGYQMIPILVYQRLSKEMSDQSTVTMENFEKQMKYLKKNNYHAVTLDQLCDFIDFKDQLPKNSIVITFDGDYDSFYDIALPILEKYNFCCTLFLTTDFLKTENGISWKKIKNLAKKGVDIQQYSTIHTILPKLRKMKENGAFDEYIAAIEGELIRSKEDFEKNVKKKCRYLAYEYSDDGRFNNLFIILLKKLGYRTAFTAKDQANPFFVNNYMINRSNIYGSYTMEDFTKRLITFYEIDLR
ncbi:MAG: polysaccharide deacetylase family protein [bacterium]